MSLKVKIYTFGCKVNQYNSELIKNNLVESGIIISNDRPDYNIINVCSLTKNAEKKVRFLINRLKRETPESKIILTGCIEKDEIKDIDYIIPVREKEKIYEIFKINNIKEYIEDFGEHTRAFVMVQEGCENFCSYCIVPYRRDRMYSKPIEVFKKEIKELAKQGYKEVVLTGTHINKYSYKDYKLKDLIDIIEKEDKIKRFRISSIEPNEIDEEFFKAIENSKKFCSHLHLSIQSASNKILEKMKRKYYISDVEKMLSRLSKIKDFEFSSDFIVGFPQENEIQFQETVDFVKKYKPVFLHVFPFSKRPGTEAWNMNEDLSNKDKKNRAVMLREIEKKVQKNVFEKYKNRTMQVLIEKIDNTYYTGYTQNYIKVFIKDNKEIKTNSIYDVKIKDVFRNGMEGEII